MFEIVKYFINLGNKKGRLPIDFTTIFIVAIIVLVILFIIAGIFYKEIAVAFGSAFEKISLGGRG